MKLNNWWCKYVIRYFQISLDEHNGWRILGYERLTDSSHHTNGKRSGIWLKKARVFFIEEKANDSLQNGLAFCYFFNNKSLIKLNP